MDESTHISEENSKKIALSEYSKALMNFSSKFILPIFWGKPNTNNTDINNGTMFFIDSGKMTLALTASHVYQTYLEAKQADNGIVSQLGNVTFNLENRLIENNPTVDIATFKITNFEIQQLRRLPFRGSQSTWPPTPPTNNQPVFFGGYPRTQRTIGQEFDVDFGLAFILCLASNVNSQQMTCQIEHNFILHINGSPPLDENYFWGGTSGAPVIKIVRNTIETFELAGVVSHSWDKNTILVSHVRHINDDGTLKS